MTAHLACVRPIPEYGTEDAWHEAFVSLPEARRFQDDATCLGYDCALADLDPNRADCPVCGETLAGEHEAR